MFWDFLEEQFLHNNEDSSTRLRMLCASAESNRLYSKPRRANLTRVTKTPHKSETLWLMKLSVQLTTCCCCCCLRQNEQKHSRALCKANFVTNLALHKWLHGGQLIRPPDCCLPRNVDCQTQQQSPIRAGHSLNGCGGWSRHSCIQMDMTVQIFFMSRRQWKMNKVADF